MNTHGPSPGRDTAPTPVPAPGLTATSDPESDAGPAPTFGLDPRGCPRLLTALSELDELVGQAVDMPGWSLSDGDLDSAVLDCSALLARLAALRLGLINELHGRGSAQREGATSTAALLRARLRIRPGEAQRLLGLALAVDGDLTATGTALTAGTISIDQAFAIHAALRALPRGADLTRRREAEALLLRCADTFDPADLALLGRHIRERLTDVDTSPGGDSPDPADDSNSDEGGSSDDDDGGDHNPGGGDAGGGNAGGGADGDDPTSRRHLSITDLADGMTRITGELDAEGAALLRTALDSLAAPSPAVDGTPDPRSPARRRGDALVELLHRALDASSVPVSGGVRPHLTVTVPWATLVGRGGPAAATSWGQPLPRSVLRRLSCDAEVSRIVLNADSVPLDVGRTQRTVPADLRRALVARDRCCAFPGCSRPPSWCQAHHIRHWTDDGTTCLDNLVLVCGWHHRFLHHHGWTVRLGADRRPEFLPPVWVDPTQTPRRNPYTRPLEALLSRPADR
ncbi:MULTISPECIES: HNH endonuclease signature motif containing protein [Frankia]|nr:MULTISPECIES: HNH endonuclease signature motif containing protein [Frankia]